MLFHFCGTFFVPIVGMTNKNQIAMDTMYAFIFAGDDKMFDSTEISRMQTLDYKIKETLMKYFGW